MAAVVKLSSGVFVVFREAFRNSLHLSAASEIPKLEPANISSTCVRLIAPWVDGFTAGQTNTSTPKIKTSALFGLNWKRNFFIIMTFFRYFSTPYLKGDHRRGIVGKVEFIFVHIQLRHIVLLTSGIYRIVFQTIARVNFTFWGIRDVQSNSSDTQGCGVHPEYDFNSLGVGIVLVNN